MFDLSSNQNLVCPHQTTFIFACYNWVDDAADLPLLYSFFYRIADDKTEVDYQLITLSASTRYAGALLPQGGGNASKIIGHAYIEDQMGASSSATDSVVSQPATKTSVPELANKTYALLESAFASGDVGRVFQTMVRLPRRRRAAQMLLRRDG